MPALLLGTYTDVTHLVDFTPPSGSQPPSIRHIKDLPIPRASWIARHPTHSDIFYIAHEADDGGGAVSGVEGKLWVYRITPEGDATRLGEVSSVDNPCHVIVVAGGKGLAAANFTGGSALLVPLKPDGTFEKHADNNYLKFTGDGDQPSKCHQCVPVGNDCWVVDTGSACLRKMEVSGSPVSWTAKGQEQVLKGNGPRQAVVSDDGKHLYTLHARSCLVSHHDLTKSADERLVSTTDILPPAWSIDMNNRTPPYTFAAALNLHAPSSTLIATSRMLRNSDVDSVAFLKLDSAGNVIKSDIVMPKRGKEYRGVGVIGNCYLVAGQTDGWLTCFEWDEKADKWEEREFERPVNFEKVVDIESF